MHIKLFIAFSFLIGSINLIGQNHPTISNLTVNYKSLPQSTLNVNTTSKVIAQATLTLVDANSVASINFKIINSTTNAIEYQVNYNNISSNSLVKGTDGRKHFEINGNTVVMNVPQQLAAGQYVYQVFTKNNLGVSSPTYSLTH